MRDACKRGVAGVIVTHDAQLASWADRVVFLRDGRMVDHSPPTAGPDRCSQVPRRDEPVPDRRWRAARRAIVRWAWRLCVANGASTRVILALLTIAVAATMFADLRPPTTWRRLMGTPSSATPTALYLEGDLDR